MRNAKVGFSIAGGLALATNTKAFPNTSRKRSWEPISAEQCMQSQDEKAGVRSDSILPQAAPKIRMKQWHQFQPLCYTWHMQLSPTAGELNGNGQGLDEAQKRALVEVMPSAIFTCD